MLVAGERSTKHDLVSALGARHIHGQRHGVPHSVACFVKPVFQMVGTLATTYGDVCCFLCEAHPIHCYRRSVERVSE